MRLVLDFSGVEWHFFLGDILLPGVPTLVADFIYESLYLEKKMQSVQQNNKPLVKCITQHW
jgi:hypothetical protein